MKIALFSDTFDEVNGVANTLGYLADYAQKQKIRIDFFVHATKEKQKEFKKKEKYTLEKRGSVRIYRFKAVLPFEYYNGLLLDLAMPRYAILKRFEKKKYDLIHTATPGSMGITAAYLAAHYKLPMIGVYHTAIPEYIKPMAKKQIEKWTPFLPAAGNWVGENLESLSREMLKWYYNQCALVLAPSQYFQEQLTEMFTSPIEIFTRGVDTQKFKPKKSIDSSQTPTAIYVGRVSVEKNLQILIDIFKDQKNCVLKVVGDGPFREEMEKNLPMATFTGFLHGKDLVEAYASADFFIFPSETDTFGNVVLEAMSCGLPVLVSNKMAPKELVHQGENGFVCATLQEFQEKVDLLSKDRSLQKRMRKKALAYARSRSWDEVFEALIEQYQKTIKVVKTKKKIKGNKTTNVKNLDSK